MGGEIFQVEDVICRLKNDRHRHETENLEQIQELWTRQKAKKPELFDGETVLASAWRIDGKVLRIECQRIRYAALLHWLDTPGLPGIANSGQSVHFFSSAVMISGDGKVLMGRMAEHTANAGRIYMPSGSMEIGDFHNGRGDLSANMRREVLEETGIDLKMAEAGAQYSVYRGRGILALFRLYKFSNSSVELLEQAQRHLKRTAANGGANELAEVMMNNFGEVYDTMPAHVQAYMAQLCA